MSMCDGRDHGRHETEPPLRCSAADRESSWHKKQTSPVQGRASRRGDGDGAGGGNASGECMFMFMFILCLCLCLCLCYVHVMFMLCSCLLSAQLNLKLKLSCASSLRASVQVRLRTLECARPASVWALELLTRVHSMLSVPNLGVEVEQSS